MGVGLLHDPEYKEQDVDVEAGVYLKQPVEMQALRVHRRIPHGELPRPVERHGGLAQGVTCAVRSGRAGV